MTTTNEKKKRLLMLEDVRVASPCPARWDEMLGDERVRFCTGCEKNVYNISMMSKDEAEELISEREGDVCVRFFQRADGTIMTSDCSVGAKRKLRKKAALSIAAAGAMALAAVGVHLQREAELSRQSDDVTGVNPPPPPPPVEPPPVDFGTNNVWENGDPGHWIAGGLHAAPPIKEQPKKPVAKR